MDPDDLPEGEAYKMDFGSGGNTRAKAWRDIWGAGQGVGSMRDIPALAILVDRLEAEYNETLGALHRR
jgi:nitronate monooxygenase